MKRKRTGQGFKELQAETPVIRNTVEEIKRSKNAIETAHLMQKLSDEGLNQAKIAKMVGKSRSSCANTLRLLNLADEVIGLVESGKLSEGHARALLKVPKDKQYPFALETIKKDCSVRETERAVKMYMTPKEVLSEEQAQKSQALRLFVDRVRALTRTNVSLLGNQKKGRIYIDYYTSEDIKRFEKYLDILEREGEEN